MGDYLGSLRDQCARDWYKKDSGWTQIRNIYDLDLSGAEILEGHPTNFAAKLSNGDIIVVEIGGYEYDLEAWKKK